jgi:hypothetical protein
MTARLGRRVVRSQQSPVGIERIVMSLVEGLASLLREMALGELGLALAAILAYSIAINSSYSSAMRSGAASVAFASAMGFTTLSPAWMSAIVFLGLAVVAVAVFAGLAWTMSSLLGLGAVDVRVRADEVTVAPSLPQPTRGFAPHTSAQPL